MSNIKSIVLYFSGTGNSFLVANDIAQTLSSEILPVARFTEMELSDFDTIGIVFPAYYVPFGGLPIVVRTFACNCNAIKNKYIFAVCTYGSGESGTIKYLARLLDKSNVKLSASFAVNMPENIHPSLAYKKHELMFDVWHKNIERTCEYIQWKQSVHITLPNNVVGKLYPFMNTISIPLKNAFRSGALKQLQEHSHSDSTEYTELIHKSDESFHVGDACKGCETCSRVCPVNNIKMNNGKPVWSHNCEFCLGCINWCPQNAITSDAIKVADRYRHPQVKVMDMIKNNEKKIGG